MKAFKGDYLNERGLKDALISAWGVRQDSHGNACFPHYDLDGLCGWEIKNRGVGGETTFTNFSSGGHRGLAILQLEIEAEQHRIVVCEGSIDCMSYAQLFHQAGNVYLSLGGPFLPTQGELLLAVFECFKPTELVVATDADLSGSRIGEEICKCVPSGLKTRCHKSSYGKDWSEYLQYGGGARIQSPPIIGDLL